MTQEVLLTALAGAQACAYQTLHTWGSVSFQQQPTELLWAGDRQGTGEVLADEGCGSTFKRTQ